MTSTWPFVVVAVVNVGSRIERRKARFHRAGPVVIFNTPTELPGDFHRCHLRSARGQGGLWRYVEICVVVSLTPRKAGDLTRMEAAQPNRMSSPGVPGERTSCYFHPNWAFCFCTRVTALNSLQLHTASWRVYFPHVLSFAGQQAQIQNSSGVRRGDFYFLF